MAEIFGVQTAQHPTAIEQKDLPKGFTITSITYSRMNPEVYMARVYTHHKITEEFAGKEYHYHIDFFAPSPHIKYSGKINMIHTDNGIAYYSATTLNGLTWQIANSEDDKIINCVGVLETLKVLAELNRESEEKEHD